MTMAIATRLSRSAVLALPLALLVFAFAGCQSLIDDITGKDTENKAVFGFTTAAKIPNGAVGDAITPVQMATKLGKDPVTFALKAGSTLPGGLSLSAAGVLSGTPTLASAGTNLMFTVVATDGTTPVAKTAERTFKMDILLPQP